MRSFRLLAVTVLAVVLASSSAQNAFGVTELFYDDGTAETGTSSYTASLRAVRFSLPTGWSSAKLLTAKYYIYGDVATFRVDIYDSTGVTELCCSPPLDVTPSATGWFSVGLSSYNIVVSGDFYVAMEHRVDGMPALGVDAGRSYSNTGGDWTQWDSNLMIRAEVDQAAAPPVGGPVGGVVIPLNTFAVLAPWLAVIGLVGGIGTVVVVARKRRL